MTTYPLFILITLCLFCVALGAVIAFVFCACWFLRWLAEGEADVNGSPERDASQVENTKDKTKEAICTSFVVVFLIVSVMALLGNLLFKP